MHAARFLLPTGSDDGLARYVGSKFIAFEQLGRHIVPIAPLLHLTAAKFSY